MLSTMFEIFLYLLAIVSVFWLTSEPQTGSNTIVRADEKLNSNADVGKSAVKVNSLNDLHSSIGPNSYFRETPSSPPLYPWVAAKKAAEENFCRLDNNRLCVTRSYVY